MMQKQKISEKLFNKALTKSQKLGENATEKEAGKIEKRLSFMNRGRIAEIWDKVLFLWDKYRSPEVPLKLKITIIGALLYLILPADVLPDYIPGIGLIDDFSVIMFVFGEVSKFALPKIQKKIGQKVYESFFNKIDDCLSKILKSAIINTIIGFILNAAGCLLLIIKPFGKTDSTYAALAVFAFVFIWTVFRIAKYLIKYGKVSLDITIAVIKSKGISKGVAKFIKSEYRYIAYLYGGISIANNFIPEVSRIPDLDQIIKTFEVHYKKSILLTILLFALYSVLVFVTKYMIIH